MIETRFMMPGEAHPRVGFFAPGDGPPADATDISYRSVASPLDGDFGEPGDAEAVTAQPNPAPRRWDGTALDLPA